MTKTKDELVERALEKLKVTGSGQPAAAEDVAFVDKVVDTLMADLATRQIFAWGDPDQLPDDAFEHLADLLANATASDFGKQGSEEARLLAERRLRQLDLYQLSYQVAENEYF